MVSTFSVPESLLKGGDMAGYTCPGATPGRPGSDGAYAQCDGGICFKSTQKKSFPGFDEPLAKDEIICSCPITTQKQTDPVGYQIAGPYPCQQSFFDNCKSTTANSNTGSTLFVGAPTGTADLLTKLLIGFVPPSNRCFPSPLLRETSHYASSFDMMTVPAAANMPPTPWQTEILVPGSPGGSRTHLVHAPPAIHPGMHVREPAAIRHGLKNLGFALHGEGRQSTR